ncbi:MAG: hypothetical protein KDE33_28120, partial [Bacteroidetes bacterium]|nr:hypothetical protein [Bacteroidota bacterium]
MVEKGFLFISRQFFRRCDEKTGGVWIEMRTFLPIFHPSGVMDLTIHFYRKTLYKRPQPLSENPFFLT